MWVDGGTLWMAGGSGSLYSVPTTGGTSTLVGQVPGMPDPNSDNLMVEHFALDDAHVYLTAMRLGGPLLEVWSIARTGGATQLLFSSSDARYTDAYTRPLAAAGDALYFTADGSHYSGLLRLPKVGGTPALVRPDVYYASLLVPLGATFYTNGVAPSPPGTSQLARVPVDPALPPVRISGVGFGMVDVGVGDDAGAYAGFVVGVQPAESPWALAALPRATEQSKALGCTATLDGGGFLGLDMALTATHVYALITDLGSSSQRFQVVRAAR